MKELAVQVPKKATARVDEPEAGKSEDQRLARVYRQPLDNAEGEAHECFSLLIRQVDSTHGFVITSLKVSVHVTHVPGHLGLVVGEEEGTCAGDTCIEVEGCTPDTMGEEPKKRRRRSS